MSVSSASASKQHRHQQQRQQHQQHQQRPIEIEIKIELNSNRIVPKRADKKRTAFQFPVIVARPAAFVGHWKVRPAFKSSFKDL